MAGEPQTTPAVLERIASELPDHDAVITSDRRITFGQLRAEVRQAAGAMLALGVAPGDRVAIWSPNTWHWVVGCLAAQYAGAAVVPVNTRYTAMEATDILARTKAPLLLAMGAFLGADKVAELDRGALPDLRHIVRIALDTDDGTWEDFVAHGVAGMEAADIYATAVGPNDVADILFTSGTTGRSKGVLCAHRQSLAGSAAWAACGKLSSADRYLGISPFFHAFGYKAGILACLQTGATLIPELTFDPAVALRAVSEQRITVLTGPPTIFQTLLDHPARADSDLSSLRLAVTGATTVPVALIERMHRELDIDIVLTGYGLTESSGFGTLCRPDDDAVTVASTCGRPMADFELRIEGVPGPATGPETGPATGPDAGPATGEVLLRGPNVMLGYLDDPQATAAVIDADGWLHTGDVGRLDAAGNLQITDRLKDMYICGGFNVYPAEVEQVLARQDGVVEAAVIGVPDERLGEVGRAFVVARPGSELDEEGIIDATRQYLANFKLPRSVRFVAELPRNAAGKVVKPILRELD